jgi:hypothetical protein
MFVRRKVLCKNEDCKSDPVYIQGSDTSLMSMPRLAECLECGDKRREHEQKRKQRNQKKLLARFAANQ